MLAKPTLLEWNEQNVMEFWNAMDAMGYIVQNFGEMTKEQIYWVLNKYLVKGGRHIAPNKGA